MLVHVFFFVFKQKTAYEMRISDWSSDVCSSDLTGASARNWASYGNEVTLEEGLPGSACTLLTDPQTSGGLLISCKPDAADQVLQALHADGFGQACIIGDMVSVQPKVTVSSTDS